MAVPPVGSSTGNDTSTTPTTKTQTLDYDAFLKLLIAQMQNQDPTKPMDSTQFVAQLASFSNVEQGIKTNSKLDSLMTAIAFNQAEGMIGRVVTSADGKTSGVVESVRIITGGAVAQLANGTELPLDAGVTVSAQ